MGQRRTKPTLRSTSQQSHLDVLTQDKVTNLEQPSSLTVKSQLLEKYYCTRKPHVVQRGEKEMTVTFMNYPVLEL